MSAGVAVRACQSCAMRTHLEVGAETSLVEGNPGEGLGDARRVLGPLREVLGVERDVLLALLDGGCKDGVERRISALPRKITVWSGGDAPLSSKKTTVPYEAAKPSTFECDLFFCSSSLNSCFCWKAVRDVHQRPLTTRSSYNDLTNLELRPDLKGFDGNDVGVVGTTHQPSPISRVAQARLSRVGHARGPKASGARCRRGRARERSGC